VTRVARSRVLVVGCGGLATEVAAALAASGVGEVGLWDPTGHHHDAATATLMRTLPYHHASTSFTVPRDASGEGDVSPSWSAPPLAVLSRYDIIVCADVPWGDAGRLAAVCRSVSPSPPPLIAAGAREMGGGVRRGSK